MEVVLFNDILQIVLVLDAYTASDLFRQFARLLQSKNPGCQQLCRAQLHHVERSVPLIGVWIYRYNILTWISQQVGCLMWSPYTTY